VNYNIALVIAVYEQYQHPLSLTSSNRYIKKSRNPINGLFSTGGRKDQA